MRRKSRGFLKSGRAFCALKQHDGTDFLDMKEGAEERFYHTYQEERKLLDSVRGYYAALDI